MINTIRLHELRDEIGADNLAEVVDMFLAETEDAILRISRAALVTADDMHFLKGSAFNIGLNDLGHCCAMAEESLRKDGSFQPDLAEISALFDAGRLALKAALTGG